MRERRVQKADAAHDRRVIAATLVVAGSLAAGYFLGIHHQSAIQQTITGEERQAPQGTRQVGEAMGATPSRPSPLPREQGKEILRLLGAIITVIEDLQAERTTP